MDDVIREVAALTPGPFIHVGGDEAHSTSDADYLAFMTRMQEIVQAHGKQMLGWEEAACIELAPGSVVQHWHNEMAKCAAGQGVKVIMSPAGHAYLDMKYDDSTVLGRTGPATSASRRPTPGIPPRCSLASRRTRSWAWRRRSGPRRCARWTTWSSWSSRACSATPRSAGRRPRGRSWDDYRQRLAGHGPRLEAMGVSFYRAPQIRWLHE